MARFPTPEDTLDRLPIRQLSVEERFFRVGKTSYLSPLHFSRDLNSRFSPRRTDSGVLYLAASEEAAIGETVCRNAAEKTRAESSILLSVLAELGMYRIMIQGEGSFLDLTVDHLARYNLDARLASEYDQGRIPPYQWCPDWADKALELGLAGIRFPSRHSPKQECVALFEGSRFMFITQKMYTLDDERALAILDSVFDWGVEF